MGWLILRARWTFNPTRAERAERHDCLQVVAMACWRRQQLSRIRRWVRFFRVFSRRQIRFFRMSAHLL